MGVWTDSLPMLCGSAWQQCQCAPPTHKRQQGGKRQRGRCGPPRPPLTKGAEGSERRVSEKMGGPEPPSLSSAPLSPVASEPQPGGTHRHLPRHTALPAASRSYTGV